MQEQTETNYFYDVRVRAKGLKKRCRKVSVESFKMPIRLAVDHSEDNIKLLKEKAARILAENMKTVEAAELSLIYTEDKGDGVISFELFDKRHKVIPLQ